MTDVVQLASDELASRLSLWTFDQIEDRLVEVMAMWMRGMGRRRQETAKDGPWEMIVRELGFGPDHEHGGDKITSSTPVRTVAMSRAEIEERDRVTDWMEYVPDRDKKLVIMALGYLAKGASHVPWMEMRKPMGVSIGAGGLQRRYERAIGGIAVALNAKA